MRWVLQEVSRSSSRAPRSQGDGAPPVLAQVQHPLETAEDQESL